MENCTNQLLENVKKDKYIYHIKAIFVVLIYMQLNSKFNKRTTILLSVIDIYSKCACVVLLKDKEGVTIVNAFKNTLKISKRKPNKIWVDKRSEFYKNFFKKWLKDNGIEMNSTHNERKSVVVERFIRTLKKKIYKHMTAVSKNLYIDK